MNIAQIYSDASGRSLVHERRQEELAKLEEEKKRAEGNSVQEQFDWLQHLKTQEMIKNLTKEINDAIDQAVDMSLVCHINNTQQTIINTLVRVAILRKVLKTYATKP